MKKILIGYDVSSQSKKALNYAVTMAEKFDSELVLLFVRSKFDRSFIDDPEITEEESKGKIKEMMKSAIKTVIRSGIKVECVILKGDPAFKLIEYSEENDIDLIIIGSVGIGDSGKFKLGSVAEKLVRYSKKPIFIAR